MRKTRCDNDMTDRIGTIDPKNENELSWPIRSWAVYDEYQTKKWVTKCIGLVYVKRDIELLWSIRPSAIYDEN